MAHGNGYSIMMKAAREAVSRVPFGVIYTLMARQDIPESVEEYIRATSFPPDESDSYVDP